MSCLFFFYSVSGIQPTAVATNPTLSSSFLIWSLQNKTFIIYNINKTVKKSKQKLSAKYNVWLFTYNLSNVSIFTDNKSLVQNKKKKSYLDIFAPHHFHSAREHWGQVGCTLRTHTQKKYNSHNHSVSLHAKFKCVESLKSENFSTTRLLFFCQLQPPVYTL